MLKQRILTGARPTGRLHLGHYVGMIKNLVALQEDYDVIFAVVDYHALTRNIEPKHVGSLAGKTIDLVEDLLACGLDPSNVTFYRQSDVGSAAELALIFGMLVTVPQLERVPTLKEILKAEQIEQPSFGLLGYPVLQAADILHVRADLVPVGKDQASHLELSREIAKKFNRLYGVVFPETKPKICEVGTLPGIDGMAKMSKSLGNDIKLNDDPVTVRTKVMRMYTDPKRIHPTDPGVVEGNPVFLYHDAFNDDPAAVAALKKRYQAGTVGDVEVKEQLVDALERFLAPIRARRAGLSRDTVNELLQRGRDVVRPISIATLDAAKKAMGL